MRLWWKLIPFTKVLLDPRSKASKQGVLVPSPSIEERLPKVNRREAKRIREDYGFGFKAKSSERKIP
jgi:hypothetical protein